MGRAVGAVRGAGAFLAWGAVAIGCADPDAGAGDTGQDRFPRALAADLQQALDEGRAAIGAPGAVLAVTHPEEGALVLVSGSADLEDDAPVAPGDLFRIGSVTKLYVASVVLQLADEGLDLDDPVAAWVPWAPHGDRITVLQLLRHTSGLADHVDDLAYLAHLDEPWTPEEVVGLIDGEPLGFEPGTGFAYSNTGYVLLGEVIEAATGRPWGEAVHERILQALALDDTWLPSVEDTPPTVAGYSAGAAPVDVTDAMHPSAAGAHGEVVAAAADVARFARALLVDGGLLSERSRDLLVTTPVFADGTVSPYGAGASVTPWGEGALIGHSGQTLGFQARAHTLPRTGWAVATLVNATDAEADVIDAAVWGVLDPGRRAVGGAPTGPSRPEGE